MEERIEAFVMHELVEHGTHLGGRRRLLLLLLVVHGGAAGRRCPVLEAGFVAGPWHLVGATDKVHGRVVDVQLHVRPEEPFVEQAGVVEGGLVRELRAQVQRRQAIAMAELRLLLLHCRRRLLVMLLAAGGVCRLLAHAKVARVAL